VLIEFTVPETTLVCVVVPKQDIEIVPEGDPTVTPVNRMYKVVAATVPDTGTIVTVEEYVIPSKENS
jgi:hypothetical protein